MSVIESSQNAKCPDCGVEWNPSIERHICGLRKTFQLIKEYEWEYQVVERPTEIILVLYKRDDSTRGYIRLTSQEELQQWLKVVEKLCVKQGL